MNSLLSYCGLVVARISASEKDLPVTGEGGKILTPPCGDDEWSVPVLFLNSSLKI